METEADALAAVIRVFNTLDIPYLIGGSWALGVWSTPRLTHDIDIVVDLPLERIAAFCARLPAEQFYTDADAMLAQFRQPYSPSQGVYSFYHLSSGLKIDLFPLRHQDAVQVAEFGRRVEMAILPGQQAHVCTAQDLLVQKLRWYQLGGRQSERQFGDCLNLLLADLARATPQIDWAAVDQITRSLGPPIHEAWELLQDATQQALKQAE
jgi:hypothetical protein